MGSISLTATGAAGPAAMPVAAAAREIEVKATYGFMAVQHHRPMTPQLADNQPHQHVVKFTSSPVGGSARVTHQHQFTNVRLASAVSSLLDIIIVIGVICCAAMRQVLVRFRIHDEWSGHRIPASIV